MLKPISAMSDHEMLVELMQEKRRGDTLRNIKLVLLGVLLAVLVYLGFRYLPPAIAYFKGVGETIDKIQTGVDQVQTVTDSIKDSVGGLLEKLGGLFKH